MTISAEELESLINDQEDRHLECKEARQHLDFEDLCQYCSAFANEGGGRLVLGVTNQPPRQVVGTQAFGNLSDTEHRLLQTLRIRIEVEEISYSQKRVLVFHIPTRPRGSVIEHQGVAWMRSGASLTRMTEARRKTVYSEDTPDYTALPCGEATIADLDPNAVEAMRAKWHKKSGNDSILNKSLDQLLDDAGLIQDGSLNFAALILLGKPNALRHHLPHARAVFEYRSSEANNEYQERQDYQGGFFTYFEELWKAVNKWNTIQQYQEGFFRWDIPTFNERVIREAILNAVCHRDYRDQGEIFVKQFPTLLVVASAGGFPAGITPSNILYQQKRRNPLIADVFALCGLVERSGQGTDMMYRESIRQGKPIPDFGRSDDYNVVLRLDGQIKDIRVLSFLERIGLETTRTFTIGDHLILYALWLGDKPSKYLEEDQVNSRLTRLLDLGVIERIGKGRGVRYIPSKRLASHLGQRGKYTRIKGLARERHKDIVLQHLRDYSESGAKMGELMNALQLSRYTISGILRELKASGKIEVKGVTRNARWFVR